MIFLFSLLITHENCIFYRFKKNKNPFKYKQMCKQIISKKQINGFISEILEKNRLKSKYNLNTK